MLKLFAGARGPKTKNSFSLAPLGERGDRKAVGEGVSTNMAQCVRTAKARQKAKRKRQNCKPLPPKILAMRKLRVCDNRDCFVRHSLDPLTCPAPAGESAGCGPPSPPRGRGKCISSRWYWSGEPKAPMRLCYRGRRSNSERMPPLPWLKRNSAPRALSAWKWKAVVRVRIQLVRPNPSNARIPTKHNHAIPPSALNLGVDVPLRVI